MDMDQETLKRYIRVNHAGEFGAVKIYQGQKDALKDTEFLPLIEEMLAQEQVHLSAFEEEMRSRKIRPTLLLPLWSALGYGLGYISGKISPSTAMACTQGVEEIIDEHYARQLETIGEDEKELKEKISQFQQDEIHHKELSIEKGAHKAPLYTPFIAAVRAATLLAIFLSKRI
jgi:ubiquinone biosynthesis monooxygenase Coq7